MRWQPFTPKSQMLLGGGLLLAGGQRFAYGVDLGWDRLWLMGASMFLTIGRDWCWTVYVGTAAATNATCGFGGSA